MEEKSSACKIPSWNDTCGSRIKKSALQNAFGNNTFGGSVGCKCSSTSLWYSDKIILLPVLLIKSACGRKFTTCISRTFF